MKNMLITCLLSSNIILFSISLPAEEAKVDKVQDLLKQHRTCLTELAKLREKAISDDKDLKEIHGKIIELHSQLAEKLDQIPEIKKLNDKIIDLEKEIETEKLKTEKSNISIN
ncbi:MAG TPA: hypothetical protein PK821_00150 [Victivallales bacterium]|nr:hypothetical protein [Victivallales bacterium]